MSQTIKMLKKDAVIPINVGTGFFQKLNSMLIYLVEQQTEEEIKLFETLVKENKELPEPWMENMHTLIALLSELEKSADANGMMYDKSVDDEDFTTQ